MDENYANFISMKAYLFHQFKNQFVLILDWSANHCCPYNFYAVLVLEK